ncbi:hypothetical protein G4B88_008470, partial [Cannabis sativa]
RLPTAQRVDDDGDSLPSQLTTTETTASSPLLADDDAHLLPKSPTESSPTTEPTQPLPLRRRHSSSLSNEDKFINPNSPYHE